MNPTTKQNILRMWRGRYSVREIASITGATRDEIIRAVTPSRDTSSLFKEVRYKRSEFRKLLARRPTCFTGSQEEYEAVVRANFADVL